MQGDDSINVDNWLHLHSAIVICGCCSRLCDSLLECDIIVKSTLCNEVKAIKDLFENMSNELINYTIVSF